ncbi:PIN domain-containing protein [Nocardiopsis dassonvillei]|uniref:PIN domain-containing protein n=1 Tax=Nocardiopsis dassonvillei TaxID=2014 RepID=UPI00366D2517
MASKPKPPSYTERLVTDLNEIHAALVEILEGSAIENIDPNRGYYGSVVITGAPEWGWAVSPPVLESRRMSLLKRFRDWEPRFRLVFPHPTPEVQKRLDKGLGLIASWLIRKSGAHDVPPTMNEAHARLQSAMTSLRELVDLLPPDEHPVRLVVDTNTLIDDPDLAVHTTTVGPRYRVHLLPVVLRELDEHKLAGRNQDLREAAKKADRRLKGLRHNGDIREGVTVAGQVTCVFEHIEPKADGLPSWLDLDVPDDRFVASALLLQSGYPGSALYVATGDLNLQTKLAAVGLPFMELP